jgi:hypothetical protein
MACHEPFSAAALASLAATAGTTGAAATGGLAGVAGGVSAASGAFLSGAGVASGAGFGGSLLSALGSTSTWGSILSGVATVGSVLNTQRAGDVTAQGYELNALDAETNVKVEENQGIERRTSLKAALVKALGDRDVATAAGGSDLSFGTPVIARQEAVKDSERALTVDKQTEDVRTARLKERAASYRIAAANTRSGSLSKAAGIGITGLASVLRRG